MKRVFIVICILCLSGCASSKVNMSSITPGMTKAEVIQVLGEPTSASLQNDFSYLFFNVHDHAFGRDRNDYVFAFSNNKLVEFAPLPEDRQKMGPIDKILRNSVFISVNK